MISFLWNTWWHHQMETFSALLAICAGNSPVTGEFPAQTPVTRSFDIFVGVRLNKRLSKQWWGWWFEMPTRPLWRHCNGFGFIRLFPFGCIDGTGPIYDWPSINEFILNDMGKIKYRKTLKHNKAQSLFISIGVYITRDEIVLLFNIVSRYRDREMLLLIVTAL